VRIRSSELFVKAFYVYSPKAKSDIESVEGESGLSCLHLRVIGTSDNVVGDSECILRHIQLQDTRESYFSRF